MIFSSAIFIFLFLPAVLFFYYIIKKGWRNAFLLLASIFFYAWGEGLYAIIIIVSIVFNHYLAGMIHASIIKGHEIKKEKIFLVLAIVFNIGLLSIFKYAPFIINIQNVYSPLAPIFLV